ncbi:uncharacterized protein KD926_000006 [Aspergillus affinis]|uniref:uncharacterized protein n=1 Tax=Aspergillus affinis TaxID=1070780 RepID=UPI0022FE8EC7|nr:uncharacterized protein KD926_000006 [Aspergillus affinis]KAI9037743.1 hypothetical protein KD926_000006 [Aspergillus affinis]
MPKSCKVREERINEAAEYARCNKNLSIAKVARDFDVPYRTLHGRVSENRSPRTARIPQNKTLNEYQEEALKRWIIRMNDLYLPITISMVEEMANRTLQRTGSDQRVSTTWAYRFNQRLPDHLKLEKVAQKPKEKKRLDAEDVGLLQFWYNQLSNVLKGLPARLVYNFDECGFQPGKGKRQNVLTRKERVRDLTESEHSENITALECISADGWIMKPLFIFKGKKFMESWYHEDLPDLYTAVSEKGYINDKLALEWLRLFHEETMDRIKKGEKRVIIFDGHTSHKTVEFLQLCETYEIIPFCFLSYTTQICQPLDGTPFLAYKQKFKKNNNEIFQWTGKPGDKATFLKDIVAARAETFKQRRIRESFKERGIFPPNGSSIIEALEDTLPPIPLISAPDLRPYGETTPPPNPVSSGVF